MSDSTDSIEDLTMKAVEALLTAIADGAEAFGPYVNGATPRGTVAFFSAEALKNMLGCDPLRIVVANTLQQENPKLFSPPPTRR